MLNIVMLNVETSQTILLTSSCVSHIGGVMVSVVASSEVNRGFRLEEEVEREKSELTKDLMAIASHVTELDEATNERANTTIRHTNAPAKAAAVPLYS
jgi:hypothetical protein